MGAIEKMRGKEKANFLGEEIEFQML